MDFTAAKCMLTERPCWVSVKCVFCYSFIVPFVELLIFRVFLLRINQSEEFLFFFSSMLLIEEWPIILRFRSFNGEKYDVLLTCCMHQRHVYNIFY